MSAADRMDSCESAASMIGALLDTLAKWNVDELGDALQYLDEARGAAKAAAMRLHGEQRDERPYISSRVL